MRKRKLFWTMAAALAFVSCSQDELLENPTVLEQDAVTFDTYVGNAAQSRASIVDLDVVKVKGFGVNAFYTGQDTYASVWYTPVMKSL